MAIPRQFYTINETARFTSRPMRGEPEKKPTSDLVAQMRAKLTGEQHEPVQQRGAFRRTNA